MEVPQEPPPRPASQTSDMPPLDFVAADLLITRSGERRPYCFGLNELLSWLEKEGVRDQRWTQLAERRWRLDGYAYSGKEHTVWIFERLDDEVMLVGYKDSDIAERTPESIMWLYYPRISNMHSDSVRARYGTCENPYD